MNADVTILQLLECKVLFPECTSDLEFEGKPILLAKLSLKSRENKVEVTPVIA